MPKSLNRIVSTSFTLFFLGVLTIGCTSLLLTQRMMDKTVNIAKESRDLDFIHDLNNKTTSLITAIHYQMIHGNEKYHQQLFDLADEIEDDIESYLVRSESSPVPQTQQAVRLMSSMRDEFRALKTAAAPAQMVEGKDPLSHVDEFIDKHAYNIQAHARLINQFHFDVIAANVDDVRKDMSIVLYLYLLFSAVGLVLVYLGFRLHSRHVVRPLLELRDGAERVASGDLDVRLSSDSQTEVGTLFRAFNRMVDRLQSHNRQLFDFNQGLESKVEARTLELERTHKSLRAAQSDLQRLEKLALLGQIATSVNHEVRTPLNALYLNVQLIKRHLDNTNIPIERRSKHNDLLGRLALVDHEVNRISAMLEEFVNYARFAPPVLKDVDLNRLVNHVMELNCQRAEQARVTLEVSLAASAPHLQADEAKLTQALINLCTNALQAMPDGGVLRLSTSEDDDGLAITIADTGVGIPEENLPKVFMPFFTSKPRGMGFGLSIVQRIVEDQGGRINCRSQVGEGTVFTIQLPTSHSPTPGA